MLDPLRTNLVAGILTGMFGLLMMGFAAFGLLIVAMQRIILASMGPIPVTPDGLDFVATAAVLHRIWLNFLPLMLAGGLAFAICGLLIHRGSMAARRVAQLNACLGFVWCAAYAWASADVAEKFGQPLPFIELSPAVQALFRWVMTLVGFLISASFPAAILCILRPPRSQPVDAIIC